MLTPVALWECAGVDGEKTKAVTSRRVELRCAIAVVLYIALHSRLTNSFGRAFFRAHCFQQANYKCPKWHISCYQSLCNNSAGIKKTFFHYLFRGPCCNLHVVLWKQKVQGDVHQSFFTCVSTKFRNSMCDICKHYPNWCVQEWYTRCWNVIVMLVTFFQHCHMYHTPLWVTLGRTYGNLASI